MDSAALAAWCQAFGSIAAIGATWFVATREDRARAQDAKALASARREALAGLFEHCSEVLRRASSKASGTPKPFTKGNIGATRAEVLASIEALNAIPLFELPDGALMRSIMTLRTIMDTAARRIDLVQDQLEARDPVKADFAHLERQVRALAKDVRGKGNGHAQPSFAA